MNRLEAQQQTIVVIGLGADIYADYTPGVGEAVDILAAYAYHNEGANLDSLWAYNDGVVGMRDLCQATAVVSGNFYQLYGYNPAPLGMHTHKSLLLRWGQTLRVAAAAKTAGKIWVLVLFVDKYKGETPYVG
jgi:hypothetical protein